MDRHMGLSLRGRVLAIVLLGAVLPLALLGFWFTRTAERSGEELLRGRLEASLHEVTEDVGSRWLALRSELIDVAELPGVLAELRAIAVAPTATSIGGSGTRGIRSFAIPPEGALDAPPGFQKALDGLRGAAVSLRVVDVHGRIRWVGSPETTWQAPGRTLAAAILPVQIDIFEPASGRRLGMLDVSVRPEALLGGSAAWGGIAGSVLAAFDPVTGASLLPATLDPHLLGRGRFHWRDEPWVAVRRQVDDPPVELVLAAPVGPFAEPFREGARRNLWILGGVTILVFALATVLTRRTTRELRRLAAGAEAVAGGDLQREVEATGEDEVGRVGRAFNAMTASLRTTLDELSRRQALAAVGEFAASLAHEVRNPLTSIRLDLQRIEEGLPEDATERELAARTLRRIDRLDRSVSGALQVARSGTVELTSVDIRAPLAAAAQMARPTFDLRGTVLYARGLEGEPVVVGGDPAALERLFLNLLLNAAQAMEEGGRARVDLESTRTEVRISIRDEGTGLEPGDLERVFDPFYSTRSDGTGLGLPIARRIAQAHGGDIDVESEPGVGTTFTVHLRRRAAGWQE